MNKDKKTKRRKMFNLFRVRIYVIKKFVAELVILHLKNKFIFGAMAFVSSSLTITTPWCA
jgi:hypothetical protein